ncbi:MAG: hypothetical protein K2X27_07235 [Candidatus Obscuribacterales bacterium]|nr:hypothetical protein [Candidatus Obscuribacterales bacterium]
MFNDFSRANSEKNNSSASLADFSAVDAKKAEQMLLAGQLEKLYLMPLEFGGTDSPENTLYVPIGIAAIKSHFDSNVITPLIRQGIVTQYKATPEYQGSSFIPIRLRLQASNPGDFLTEIHIWGVEQSDPALELWKNQLSALRPVETKVIAAAPTTISLASPEDTVRSFICAHQNWETLADSQAQKLGFAAACEIAVKDYHEMLSCVCTSSVQPQPIAFGVPPRHHADLETIQSVSVNGLNATVTTSYLNSIGFESRHEYCLTQEADGWRIFSVLYLNGDEKLECL